MLFHHLPFQLCFKRKRIVPAQLFQRQVADPFFQERAKSCDYATDKSIFLQNVKHRVGHGHISNASLCLLFPKTAASKKHLLCPPSPTMGNEFLTYFSQEQREAQGKITGSTFFFILFLPGNHVKSAHLLLRAKHARGRHEQGSRLQCALSSWQLLGEVQSLLPLSSLSGSGLAVPPRLADLFLPGGVRQQ